MRQNAGNRGEVTREVGGVEVHRKRARTAAERLRSGEEFREPGGELRGGRKGKRERGSGRFYRS